MQSRKFVEDTLTMPSDMPLFNYNINFEGLRKLIESINAQANSNTEQINKLKEQIAIKLNKQKLIEQEQILNNSIRIGYNSEKIVQRLLTMQQKVHRKKDINISNIQQFGLKMQKLCNLIEYLIKTSNQQHQKLCLDDNKHQKNIDDSFKRIDGKMGSALESMNKNINMYFTQANKKLAGLESEVTSHKRETNANFQTMKSCLHQKISEPQLKSALGNMIEEVKSQMLVDLNNDSIKRLAMLNQFSNKLKEHIKDSDLQIKSAKLIVQELSEKVHKCLTTHAFEGQKLKIYDKLGEFKTRAQDLTRKNQDFIDFRKNFYQSNQHLKQNILQMDQQIRKLSQKGSSFKKIQDISQILSKLDPHLICNIQSQVKLHQKQIGKLQKQLINLQNEIQSEKNKGSSRVVQLNNGQNAQLIMKVIKQHMSNIDFDGRLKRTQKQLHDVHQKNAGVSDLQKKFYLFTRDIDIGSIMKQLRKKSDEETTRKDIKVLDTKIQSIFEYYKQLRRDIEQLYRKLGKINKETGDNASLTTKRLYSPFCLSCTNNQTPKQRQQSQSTKNWRVKMDVNNIDSSNIDQFKNTINLKGNK